MIIEQNRVAYEELKKISRNYNYENSLKIIEKKDNFVIVNYELDKNRTITAPLKIVTTDNIAEFISDSSIDLKMCYIENFDIRILDETTVSLFKNKNFSAEFSYFEGGVNFSDINFGHGNVCFSYAQFGDGDVNFNNSKLSKGNVSFYNTKFGNGKVDFGSVRFGDGEICFINANFGEGDVIFNLAKFGDGNVNFDHAQFGDSRVDFSTAQFGKGYVNFNLVQFGDGDVDFNFVQFGDGDVSFLASKFGKGTVDFKFAQFGIGKVSFLDAKFRNGYICFVKTKFGKGDVDFTNAQFDNCIIDFRFAQFCNNNISFYSVDASKAIVIFMKNQFLNHDNLRFNGVKKLEIIDCIIEKTLLLDSTDGLKINIEELSLRDTKNLGRIFIDWDTAKKAVKNYCYTKVVDNQEPTKEEISNQKANQMKMLKENYHNLGEYEWEDEAFVEYMRYKRKSQNLITRFPSWIIDLISSYGTKPFRLFVTMIVVVAIFAALFSDIFAFTSIVDKPEIVQGYNGIFQGLYFSTITFLTIGYGDISPLNTVTAFLAGVEGFLGLFLMSYFTVSVVRKTLR